ncbi:MAG: hypothetical protein PVF20_07935, partial [Desulfobacterales bacterium]
FLPMAAVVFMGIMVASPASGKQWVDFWLTVFHNNDGESQIINADRDPLPSAECGDAILSF